MKLCNLLVAASLMCMALCSSPPVYAQDTATSGGSPVMGPVDTAVKVTTVVKEIQSTDSLTLKTSDSTAVKVPSSTITAPSSLTVGGVKLPAWLWSVITTFLTLLPGIQLILKRTPSAAPIAGIVGKVLNFLTWFQGNVKEVPPPNTTTTSGLSSKTP